METNRVGVITRFRVCGSFMLPDCEDKHSKIVQPVHPTEHVGQLSLILHDKWLLLKTNLVICLELMLINCILGLQLRN